MLKVRSKDGVTVVTENGETKLIGTLTDAVQYVAHELFIAQVSGKYTPTRLVTQYPVKSLLPPTKTKVVKVYILNEEAV